MARSEAGARLGHRQPTAAFEAVLAVVLAVLPLADALAVLPLAGALAALPLAAPAPAEAPTREVALRPGQTEEVSFPAGTDLAVSRRGVVDVFHAGDERWQLTGLHAGFVVIDARDAVTGEPRWPRLLVDVAAPAPAPTADAAAPARLPAWLCRAPGIACDEAAGIVSGLVASHLWYARARAACQPAHDCLFAATLTPAALAAWLLVLRQALGDGFAVSAGAGGLPRVAAYCGKAGRPRRAEEADAATGGLVSAGLVRLACREDDGPLRYRLRARVYQVEASAARELGFDAAAAVQLTAEPPAAFTSADTRLLARLKALEVERRAAVVGEPVVRLTPNEAMELVSGGEFQVLEQVVRAGRGELPEERASWKQHGLTLKVLATPVAPDRARLTYEMTLKTRTQASELALAVNTLRSDVDVALGAPVMAGVLDLSMADAENGALPWLARLPIIGPLVRRQASQRSASQLLLWLELGADQADAPLKPGLPPPTAGLERAAPP